MKEILKILKQFTVPIILVVIFLYAQAMCDLTLPDYTANIVNVGIQRNGIEEDVPKILSKETFDYLEVFLDNESDREFVNNSYTLVDENSTSYNKIKSENKIEGDKSFYYLDSQVDFTMLKSIIKIPFLVVSNISDENEMIINMKNNMSQTMGITAEMINTETMIRNLDQSVISTIKEGISKQFESLDDSMISQYIASSIKNEYQKANVNLDSLQMQYIVRAGIKMLGLALVIMVLTFVVAFISSKIAAKMGKILRSKIANKVMKFSNKEFEEFSTASLITRSTNDIQQVQMMTVMMLRMVIYSPILGIGALTKVIGSPISWIIAVAVAVIISIMAFLFVFAMPKFRIVQEFVDKLNLVTREILTGLPVIRAFATEKYEENRFNKANDDLTRVNLFVNRVMTVMMPTMMFIMNAVSIMVIWFGSKQVDFGTMQVGTLMAFITYSMQIIMSFLMISMMSVMLPRAFVSVRRIGEVLDKDESIKETKKPETSDEKYKGIVEFKNVTFAYPDANEPVLKNISFKIEAGKTLAIIGTTGSGKSTLVKLIPRFSDITEGEILVNNINIKNMSLKDLRNKIGYVPQKGILFSGTIKSNIAFSDEDMSIENVEEAARVAQATEFIEKKDEKYLSLISQGGINVSGGQRQRLQIARAIAKKPEIYIFDDSFSALDYKTDIILRQELNKYTKESTKIIVAQRISTVLTADKIIVLDEGKIESIGTHDELMKNSQVYQQIALSQLSEEELENGKQ